jgi:hypothetical protein
MGHYTWCLVPCNELVCNEQTLSERSLNVALSTGSRCMLALDLCMPSACMVGGSGTPGTFETACVLVVFSRTSEVLLLL